MPAIDSLLRYYFITDHETGGCPPVEQVHIALAAGATIIQYRNKTFDLNFYTEVQVIGNLCRKAKVPLVINDNILLAKAVNADGVHLGQEDDPPALARQVLGPDAIVGLSVSTLQELEASSLAGCDYIGNGPIFGTQTKLDAKAVRGLEGLAEMVRYAPLPVVAIGGITAANAAACFERGAAGVAVISAITRAGDPSQAALKLAEAIRAAP